MQKNRGKSKQGSSAVTRHMWLVRPGAPSFSGDAPGLEGRPEDASADRGRAAWKRAAYLSIALLVGALLGRAVILGIFSPFPLAAYAASQHMKKGVPVWLAAGLVIGSATAVSLGASPLLIVATLASYRLILAVLRHFESVDVHLIPFLVFVVDAGVRFGFSLPLDGFTAYNLATAAVDGALCMILTVLYLQMPPFLTTLRPPKALRPEELVGFVILLASLLTGLQGVRVFGASVESVLAQYLVVLFAGVGGAGVGGAVGIVTGVILVLGMSVYRPLIGVLGFAGVLSGTLREASRYAAAAGFFVGEVLLSLYTGGGADLWVGVSQTAAAVLLFLLTPAAVLAHIGRFVPGTAQYGLSQHEHARRIRELMVSRIQEAARVFAQISSSFKETEEGGRNPDAAVSQAIERTVGEVCSQCRKYRYCWQRELNATYEDFEQTVKMVGADPDASQEDLPARLGRRCIQGEAVLNSLRRSRASVARELAVLRQVRESRNLVASQLDGVARIMTDLAGDIQREKVADRRQEAQILGVIGRLGLEVQGVDILSLEEGQVEIEILQRSPSGHDECGKLVAPLLSEVLGETISVQSTHLSADRSFQIVTLTSSRKYQISAGFAGAAKDGGLQSGDSYSVMDVGDGRSAIALSDGMGNGERASKESTAAVTLVQQLLKAGFDEGVAIRTVNSALLLRSGEEMFATLDLAVVDLYSARVDFLKVGSVSSYIKRGKEVLEIRGESLPIGILADIEVQVNHVTAAEGDILVFMSDGIHETLRNLSDPEDWIRRQLSRLETQNPQLLADLLLESAVRAAGGAIRDDMTVVCAKIERFKPQWATIRLPNLPSLRGSRAKRPPRRQEQTRLVQV